MKIAAKTASAAENLPPRRPLIPRRPLRLLRRPQPRPQPRTVIANLSRVVRLVGFYGTMPKRGTVTSLRTVSAQMTNAANTKPAAPSRATQVKTGRRRVIYRIRIAKGVMALMTKATARDITAVNRRQNTAARSRATRGKRTRTRSRRKKSAQT